MLVRRQLTLPPQLLISARSALNIHLSSFLPHPPPLADEPRTYSELTSAATINEPQYAPYVLDALTSMARISQRLSYAGAFFPSSQHPSPPPGEALALEDCMHTYTLNRLSKNPDGRHRLVEGNTPEQKFRHDPSPEAGARCSEDVFCQNSWRKIRHDRAMYEGNNAEAVCVRLFPSEQFTALPFTDMAGGYIEILVPSVSPRSSFPVSQVV